MQLKYKHGIQAVNRWHRVTLNCRRRRQRPKDSRFLLTRGKLFETCSSVGRARAPIFWEILQLPNIQDSFPRSAKSLHARIPPYPPRGLTSSLSSSSLAILRRYFCSRLVRALNERAFRFFSKRICIPTSLAGRKISSARELDACPFTCSVLCELRIFTRKISRRWGSIVLFHRNLSRLLFSGNEKG